MIPYTLPILLGPIPKPVQAPAQMVFEELKSKPSDDKLYKNKQNAIYQNEEKFIGAKISDEFDEKVLDTVNLLLKKEK